MSRTNNTGPGSLPVIINTANSTPGDNIIEFSVAGTIGMVVPLPTITNNLTINGRSNIVISGSGVTNLFTFSAGTTNVLSTLMIRDAAITGNGAAISNAGKLIISACVLTNNSAITGFGGAVFNAGSLTLVDSSVVSNRASAGGAIYNSNITIIASSELSGNKATNGNGGGIWNTGSLVVSNCLFSLNSAGNGGGLFNQGTLTLAGSTVSSNLATLGFGGGIYCLSNATINSVALFANMAQGRSGGSGDPGPGGGGSAGMGGALFVATGVVSMTNSTLSGNAVIGGAGGRGAGTGAPGFGTSGASGGDVGFGGGGRSGSDSFNPNGSPGDFGGGGGAAVGAYGNHGQGGYGGGNGAYGGSSTVNLGSANNGGGGGGGIGGAIFVRSGSLVLVNSTITLNSAVGGVGGSGVSYSGDNAQGIGGGVFNLGGNVKLQNTIAAGNIIGFGSSPDVAGVFVSQGFNLIGNNQGATNLSINDYQNEVANLGLLQNNGGSTFTHALLPGSLAIGGGTGVGAPATDQRGVFRPAGFVDIGAFQLITKITPTIAWTTPADISYGTALGNGHLNATCGVPGSFVFNPPAGTILNAGAAQTLSALFIPTDIINYASNTATVSLNVLKANQGIAFSPLPIHQFGDPPFLLGAVPSSGLPVAYSILSGPAFLVGNLVTLGASQGLVTIQASQSGNTNYNAAANVSQSFYLGTPTYPVITQQPQSVGAVPGDRIVFSVGVTGAPLTYQWQFMGANIAGETNLTLTLQRASSGLSGPYTVLVSNPGGTVVSAIANLTVNVATGTPIIITQPQGQTIQAGNGVNLSLAASGTGLTYQWHQGSTGNTNTPIAGAIAANYSTPALNANAAYWCLVRNTAGLADSQTANISVQPHGAAANIGIGLVSAISIAGTPGANYRVDYASDAALTNWVVLTNFALPSTPYLFLDFGVSNAQRRFYRVVAP